MKNSLGIEGDDVMVQLTNPVEVGAIEELKADFTQYLRQQFNSPQLQLNHQINVEKAADRPYTPKEKFEAMLKKNPALSKLKDTFGLDTDF